jgi:hypothetical protein
MAGQVEHPTSNVEMNRFQDAEELAATVRAEIPSVSVAWLAALRAPLEELTMAAVNGVVSDAEFLNQVDAFIKKLPELMETMDHDALGNLLEEGMGAAMGNGIAQRTSNVERRTSNEPAN